jgi:hypothetical protein
MVFFLKIGFVYNLASSGYSLVEMELELNLPKFFLDRYDKQAHTPRFGCRNGQQVWR